MDFPLALMKTAQAVVQDGHKLFRLGIIASATCPLNPILNCRFSSSIVVSRAIPAIKFCLLVFLYATLATLLSPHRVKSACSTGFIFDGYLFLKFPLTFGCSANGGCAFERELSKGNDDRLFYFTSSNATFSFKISPESAGLSVIMFGNCYNNYLGVSYTVSFDIENPGGVRVSAGAL
jgi:hypothetical protein